MTILDDVNVLEFTNSAAGPFCGHLLAAWGADVVKVEPPDGAFERRAGRHHHYVGNRGKGSLSVDLKSEAGRGVIYDLIRENQVDVVLENYRPGVMESLGMDHETLWGIDDRLVYCSISGFGESGLYRDRPGLDPIAQAMSGIMHMTGHPDRKPARVGASLVDYGTATNACLSILLALRNRARTGSGTRVETSLIETAYAWAATWSVNCTLYDADPQRMGDKIENYAPVGAYETADGLVYLAVFGNSLWERFCDSLSLDTLVDHRKFGTPEGRREHRVELDGIIADETAEYDSEDLVSKLVGAGVPAAKIRSPREVMTDEHLQSRDMLLETETADGETVVVPNVPQKVGGIETAVTSSPPAVGADTGRLLKLAGYSSADIAAMSDEGTVVRSDEES